MAARSSALCHHSSELICEGSITKTTITAENEVEANKLSNNYRFGFKKWKSHVTERPWEDRSEIVKELYSELNTIKTQAGKLSWRLAGYFFWPFGKSIQKTEVVSESGVILCCYHAFNSYYYKYAVDGINVFAVNLLPLVIVSLVLGYADGENRYASSTVKFAISLCSIIPLSYYIGMAIASISAQSNFAVGAVMNATFGSITELTFYITALIKGSREGNKCYDEIVKSALTGTLLGCVLFIPGVCMIIGGCKHQEQVFNSRSAGVSSTLLFISVGGAFAPTLFSKAYGNLVCQGCTNVSENGTGPFVCKDCHYDLPVGFILIFSDLHLWASMFSVILMNYIFMDGKCDYFQGTALVVVYLILLAMYYFAPSPAGC
ncbi:UNVERIFIED_CONTAM: hypothetical protein FKN15_032525 [Acipenser sinensis]